MITIGTITKLPEKKEFIKGTATTIVGMTQEFRQTGRNEVIDEISQIPIDIDLVVKLLKERGVLELDKGKLKQVLEKWENCSKKGDCCNSCEEERNLGWDTGIDDKCCCKHENSCDVANILSCNARDIIIIRKG